MTNTWNELHLEDFAAHEGYIRRLAHALLANAESAEDVVQQARTVFGRRPAADVRQPRALLGGIVRNLVRQEVRKDSRRRSRERDSARPEALPSTADLVAAEEWRRKIMDAVLGLADEQREVLTMRFYGGHPPRDIAKLLGVPVETVKTRIQRGLVQLRSKLAAEVSPVEFRHGLTLVGAASIQESGTAGAGGLTLLSSTWGGKTLVFAALLLGIGLLGWRMAKAPLGPRVEPLGDALMPEREAEQPTAEPAAKAAASLERAQAQEVAPEPSPAALSGSPVASMDGVVRDREGLTFGGATVRAWNHEQLGGRPERPADRSVSTDANGRFELEGLGPWVYVEATTSEREPLTAARGWLGNEGHRSGVLLLVAMTTDHEVSVYGESGTPVEGAQVELLPKPFDGQQELTPWEDFYAVRAGAESVRALTGSDGRVLFPGLAMGPVRIVVTGGDYLPSTVALTPTEPVTRTTVSLELGQAIEGRVISVEGDPIEGALVRFHRRPSPLSVRTGADGRFRIGGLKAATRDWIQIQAEGFVPLAQDFRLDQERSGEPLLYRLERGYSLRGTLRRLDGRPLAGAKLELIGPSLLRGNLQRPLHRPPTLEMVSERGLGQTDAKGAFRMAAMAPGPYSLRVTWQAEVERSQWLAIELGADPLDLVVDTEGVEDVRFSGQVLDALTGRPVENYSIQILGQIPDPAPWTYNSVPLQVEDAEGRFQLNACHPGQLGFFVRAQGYRDQGVLPKEFGPGVYTQSLKLYPHRGLTLRFVDQDGQPLGGSLSVSLDGGRAMPMPLGPGSSSMHLDVMEDAPVVLQNLPAREIVVTFFPSKLRGENGASPPPFSFPLDLTEEQSETQVLAVEIPD